MRLISILVGLSFVLSSCSSYRVVSLTRGIDQEGEVRDFYAVAENNVIIPEYVINERGEYPTDPGTARKCFEERHAKLEAKIKEKYKVPGDFSYGTKSVLLGTAFFLVFPVAYPLYYFGSEKGERSPAKYFDLMVHGSLPRSPEFKDDFANF